MNNLIDLVKIAELSPIIIAFTQAFKIAKVPSFLLPIVAIIVGAGVNAVASNAYTNPVVYLIGAIAGLATTGVINFVDTKITKYVAKKGK